MVKIDQQTSTDSIIKEESVPIKQWLMHSAIAFYVFAKHGEALCVWSLPYNQDPTSTTGVARSLTDGVR